MRKLLQFLFGSRRSVAEQMIERLREQYHGGILSKRDEKKIESLKQFFAVSVAAFEMMHSMRVAYGYKGDKGFIHKLHLIAKAEIEKEHPDINKINVLLSLMEDEAEENSKGKDFSKGGIHDIKKR